MSGGTLFCQECGAEEANGICPRCGTAPPIQLSGSIASLSDVGGGPPATPPTWSDYKNPVPVGVSGWLLFFCISMTVFGPFFEGKIAFTALRNLTRTISVGTMLRLLSVGTIYFGLSIFSIWAGIWLWSEDRRGLSMAKAYLLVAPVIVISLYGILALSGLTVNLPIIIFQRLIYSAVWYAYLTRSKRVRDTFFRPA
jgi:hypothetical protein